MAAVSDVFGSTERGGRCENAHRRAAADVIQAIGLIWHRDNSRKTGAPGAALLQLWSVGPFQVLGLHCVLKWGEGKFIFLGEEKLYHAAS